MTRSIIFAVLLTAIFCPPVNAIPYAQRAGGCVKGDCFNGYGTYQYANGNEYIGNFAEGQPHGDGILYFANGSKYIGSWQQSWRQGRGRFVFAEGHEYLGDLSRNQFQGKGTMKYANGDRYEGDWRANEPEGLGQYFFQNGGRYEGGFESGRFQGQGTMFYPEGTRFAGQWQQGRKHGSGIFYGPAGKQSPEEWADGELRNGGNGHSPVEESAPATPPATPVSAEPETPDRGLGEIRVWAVVVGVAEYTHMPMLRYTDDDAYQFYAFLRSPNGGAVPDGQIRVLIDDNATRDNILSAMREVWLKADENDVVLFYFSGHGIQGAFVPVDFDGAKNRLEHADIRRYLELSKARHKIVLGDACHAGSLYGMSMTGEPLASRSTAADMVANYYKAFENCDAGMALLLSSKGREVSLEDTGLRSGVFSHFLIRGLAGHADFDGDGIVTITELYQYTNTQVTGYTAGAQTPVITGDYDERMPVAVVR